MKTQKVILSMLLSIFVAFTVNNVAAQKNMNICQIKAKIACQGCKEKIEENIAFQKGVKDVNADINTKIVVIKYKKNKNSAENFVKVISDLGYGGELISDVAYTKDGACCDKNNADHKNCCKNKQSSGCNHSQEGHNCQGQHNHNSGGCAGHSTNEEEQE